MWILKNQKIIALENSTFNFQLCFCILFFRKMSIQVYRESGSYAPKHQPFSKIKSTPRLNPSAHFDWKVSSDLPTVALRHYTTCVFGLFLLAVWFIGLPKGRPKTQSNKQTKGKEKQKLLVFDVWMEGCVMLLYVIGRSVLELCGQSCLRLILNFNDVSQVTCSLDCQENDLKEFQAKKMQAINLWSVSR